MVVFFTRKLTIFVFSFWTKIILGFFRYDFAVFGYFGDIIGDVFFPPQAGHAAMVESFMVFGGAFLMRPIGGCVMGYIGDLYGRKKALEISIFLMAFPTFAMGCLPTYNQLGWVSVLLLALVRMLQGLSVGGQLVSSLVFTVESRPREKWGLYGSFVMASANFGTLLGGFVAYALRSSLSEEQLRQFGWRIPFWSGILVSLSGLYLKMHGVENSHHHPISVGKNQDSHDHDEPAKNPLLEAFSPGNRRSLMSAALVPMLWSAGFYVSFVWMAIYMGKLVDPPVPGAFGVNSLSLFISVCLFFPLTGILSDHFGRTRVMYAGGCSMALTSPFLILIISYGNTIAAFFAQSFMGIILSLWGGPMCAWLVESFPPSARLTSVAIGYNIAQAVVGGVSPAIATWVVDEFDTTAPGFFISIIAFFSVFGLYCAPTNYDIPYQKAAFSSVLNDEESSKPQINVEPGKFT